MNITRCLEHKGYLGSIDIDPEAEVFHGRIEFIEDLVTFEGITYTSLVQAFRAAVDDYLQTCKDMGKDPDVPFKGTFNVRIGSDLHKRAAITARKCGQSLNDFVKSAVEQKLADDARIIVHEHKLKVEQVKPVACRSVNPQRVRHSLQSL
jgi:predicted HicB family RNase H-like nuclease